MRFLLIDDDPTFCVLTKEFFFAQEDVAVRRCTSVAEGLSAIDEVRPDVIFLDGDLTRLGAEGLEIAEKIHPRVKIYTTTGREDIQEAFQTRFGIDHVSKLDIPAIRALIDKLRTRKYV
ncbi:MAG: response regulator [bacterium]|nr:response regulator [bacterium]